MNRYDDGYYAAWCQRTSDYAGLWHDEFPWLAQLCERFSRVAGDLLAGQEVIVHGEFTPHNVIFRDGEVFPVDWESAAIGAGEIDLASLTDMWPQDDVNQAVREYVRARWPDAVPPNFSERLAAARIYWVLRWLGNRPELTVREKNRSRFALLGTYGNELGLIAP
jgi:thiamine kinase-like enzyme